MKTVKYFNFNYSTEKKVVGNYEQINDLVYDTTIEILERFQNLQLNRRDLNQEIPDLNDFKFAEEVLLTDFISNKFLPISVGLIFNELVKKIFDSIAISSYKLYNLKANSYDNKHKYNFLHIIEDQEHVSFEESVFLKNDFLDLEPGKTVEIKSLQEYYTKNLDIQKNYPGYYLSHAEIVLKKYFDIIRLPGSPVLLISEKLKDILETNNISGFHLEKSKVQFRCI